MRHSQKKTSMTPALKRLITRLRRTGSGRGFGIQSPTDYRFVCGVVNERWKYYAYDDLRRELPGLSARDRHKAELVFRIANHIQPAVTMSTGLPRWWTIYAARGCRKSTVCHCATRAAAAYVHPQGATSCKTLAMLKCGETAASDLESVMAGMEHSGSCLIADGINDSDEARRQWQRIAGDSRSTLVFDLYDIGIVIADTKRSKVTYKINY